jgi:hypothetical protein
LCHVVVSRALAAERCFHPSIHPSGPSTIHQTKEDAFCRRRCAPSISDQPPLSPWGASLTACATRYLFGISLCSLGLCCCIWPGGTIFRCQVVSSLGAYRGYSVSTTTHPLVSSSMHKLTLRRSSIKQMYKLLYTRLQNWQDLMLKKVTFSCLHVYEDVIVSRKPRWCNLMVV